MKQARSPFSTVQGVNTSFVSIGSVDWNDFDASHPDFSKPLWAMTDLARMALVGSGLRSPECQDGGSALVLHRLFRWKP